MTTTHSMPKIDLPAIQEAGKNLANAARAFQESLQERMRVNAKPTDGGRLSGIISRTNCQKHRAEYSQPCWVLYTDNGKKAAICNARARRGGAVGAISPYYTSDKSSPIGRHKKGTKR